MSSGAAIQIASYGLEDKFVSGEPSTTFFKSVYRRHTNFAIQPIEINFTGSADIGDIDIINIPRNGDLVKQIYIKFKLPTIPLLGTAPPDIQAVWTNSIANALLEYAELTIGGQTVQTLTGEYSFIQSELRTSDSKYPALQQITGRLTPLPISGEYILPLAFYFHDHPSQAIPLVALNRQDVKIRIKFRPLDQLVKSINTVGGPNADIIGDIDVANMEKIIFTPFVEYIFLDKTEQTRFMSGQQIDYLIEQNETFEFPRSTNKHNLPFRNLVKELFVIVQDRVYTESNSDTGNDWFNYTHTSGGNLNQIKDVELTFNDEVRLQKDVATGDYLKYIQPMNHHTRVPLTNIYCYSFALYPEEYEPSGSANFSRLRTRVLDVTPIDLLELRKTRVLATTMNILRVMDNMCGIVFT